MTPLKNVEVNGILVLAKLRKTSNIQLIHFVSECPRTVSLVESQYYKKNQANIK